MSTQKTSAAAVVWGTNIGVVYTPSGGSEFDSTNDGKVQSNTYTREADEQEIRDADGEVVNLTIYNKRSTLDIEVIPVGDTLATAKTANVSPDYGQLVTISDPNSAHTQIVGLHSGKYICVGSTQTSSNTGEVRISMSLRQYSTDISSDAATGA